ncbi:hypothetical protein HC891_07325 [Candidatus Gracilibacteria bacterium]|nr:hypothetical protein [Candidatus Gracilibacteria bacterium]
MAATLEEQLHHLRSLREVIGEPLFQQGLERLRAQYGSAQVAALLHADERTADQPPGIEATVARRVAQQFGDHTRIGVNIAGDVFGPITVNADGKPSVAAIVQAYAQQLISRLAAVPLHGLWEQKVVGDTPVCRWHRSTSSRRCVPRLIAKPCVATRWPR